MKVFENYIVFIHSNFWITSTNMEKNKQLRYVDAQFTVLQASYGGKYFTIQGSSTKISDGVFKHKQFALISVDSHGNKYTYIQTICDCPHLKFATDLFIPVTRR